ncbi:MAG: Zn-ribbon domain-containing OB-fold protein [Acidimicrobiales bacterium]|nr:Zn-ribbon domain-containing OB-fold protein [Acidimicrobiales bacterium]
MPTEITLPPSLQGVEPVRSIRTPARLDYTFTAATSTTEFLNGIEQRRIIGSKCPECGKVYVPLRGTCPTDAVEMTERVELPDTGVVTTFCVVNLQFYGQGVEVPYVCATVLLDGADLGLFGMISGMPAHEVRMGMRVRANWSDEPMKSLESIAFWEPTGEPDADYETYKHNL